MSGHLAYFVGQGFAACLLWWPLCFLAFRGTFKRNYSWFIFGVGYFLASTLTSIAIFISREDVVTKEVGIIFFIPLISSMAVLSAYTYLWKTNFFTSKQTAVRVSKLNGWQRIGAVLSIGWILYIAVLVVKAMFKGEPTPLIEVTAAMFLPVLMLWLVSYLLVWILGWIHDGFKKGGQR